MQTKFPHCSMFLQVDFYLLGKGVPTLFSKGKDKCENSKLNHVTLWDGLHLTLPHDSLVFLQTTTLCLHCQLWYILCGEFSKAPYLDKVSIKLEISVINVHGYLSWTHESVCLRFTAHPRENSAREVRQQGEHLFPGVGIWNSCNHSGNQCGELSKIQK